VQDVEQGYGRRFESQRDHQREHVGHHEIAEYDDNLKQGDIQGAPLICVSLRNSGWGGLRLIYF
jgi:hypothetical protein